MLKLFCLSSTSTHIPPYFIFQFSSRNLSKPNRRKRFHQSLPSSSPGTKAGLIHSFRPSTKLVTRRRCEQRHVTWTENSGGRMKRRESGARRAPPELLSAVLSSNTTASSSSTALQTFLHYLTLTNEAVMSRRQAALTQLSSVRARECVCASFLWR